MAVDARFVGVDVTRSAIEVAVRPTGEVWTASAGEDGLDEIANKLGGIHPELIVMEANGGMELPVAGTLATFGLRFALIPPRNIRDFARAIGRLSRGDQSQAGLLAHFAELVRPEARPLSDDLIQQLRHLRARRRDVVEMLNLERKRLETAPQIVLKDLQAHMQFLERSLSSINEQLNRTIRSSPVWR